MDAVPVQLAFTSSTMPPTVSPHAREEHIAVSCAGDGAPLVGDASEKLLVNSGIPDSGADSSARLALLLYRLTSAGKCSQKDSTASINFANRSPYLHVLWFAAFFIPTPLRLPQYGMPSMLSFSFFS